MTNRSHNEITAADLERAEKLLSRTYQIAVGASAVDRLADRARIDREAMERFAMHHKQTLFNKYLPNVDPRDEPAIMSMLIHFLCVGAVAQRVSEGRS